MVEGMERAENKMRTIVGFQVGMWAPWKYVHTAHISDGFSRKLQNTLNVVKAFNTLGAFGTLLKPLFLLEKNKSAENHV